MPRLLATVPVLLPLVSPAGAEDATAVSREILGTLCRTVTAYIPADDVRYRPGVNVHGQAVVPADLEGSAQPVVPDVIVIDLTVPLRDLIGDAAPALVAQSDTQLGRITVDRNTGEVLYNGQRLSGGATSELQQACLALQRKVPD